MADITPTLLDIEKTHVLYVNAHFKPFCSIAFEYDKVRPSSGVTSLGSTVTFAINDKAAGLSDKLAKIRNAIRASEDEKRRNLDAKAPEFADFRGKNRADRAQKFAKARKVWERPWRRIERLTRLEASGRQQIEKLFARGDRLTAAINRMGG
jgi:Skp family chaperone for outer membrane proteins